VTDRAVERRASFAVAVDAVAHIQRAHLLDLDHLSDRAMTDRAINSGFDMRLVNEADVIRHPMDTVPFDGLIILHRLY
jgi:hypothetical protein